MTKLNLRRIANHVSLIYKHFYKRATALLMAVVVMLQYGCAAILPLPPPVLNTQNQTTLGKAAVATAAQAPEIHIVGLGGVGEGAAQGAGAAASTCANIVKSCPCVGLGCIVCALPILIGTTCLVVATPIAALSGAANAPSAKEVQAAKDNFDAPLNAKTIQETLRDKVVAVAIANGTQLEAVPSASTQVSTQKTDYRTLATTGVDTVFEVGLTKVGLEGPGLDPPLLLTMKAHVRLIRTSDNTEFYSADYVYKGEKMKLSEWSTNQDERLLHGLNAGYESLGSDIYGNAFILYPFHDREANPYVSGLVVVEPKQKWLFRFFKNPLNDNYASVDNLQPTFRWESFPRVSDINIAPDEMGRVKNVRYDLVIAQLYDYISPGRAVYRPELFKIIQMGIDDPLSGGVVYRREGLSSNVHTIETPLNPETPYIWTVRARFELDGRQRATEWSRGWSTGGSGYHFFYYTFRTPERPTP